jgi:type II secretory pathway component GspD/PulD (secretin)
VRGYVRLLILLWALPGCQAAVARELVTEVVPLQYRSVDEVVTFLRPLVPAPGVLTGLGDQLVIKTTPENLAELRRILAGLDRAPRRLLITVHQDRREALRDLETGLTGRATRGLVTGSGRPAPGSPGSGGEIPSDDGRRGDVRVLSTRTDADEVTSQRLQVLEGHEAFIATGQSVPLGERNIISGGGGAVIQDTVRYQDVTTGFFVIARLSGQRVNLQISPHSARMSPRGGGAIDIQAASTVVSGELGDWIEIGGTTAASLDADDGIVYSTRRHVDARRAILLKVEELP